jgi:hypothetical protein
MVPSLNSKSINYSLLILTSSVFGLVFSVLIFLLEIANAIGKRFEKRATELDKRLANTISTISIKTRMELRKYFGALSISIFLDGVVLIVKTFVTEFKAPSKLPLLPPIEFVIGFVCLGIAFFLFQFYLYIYAQAERAFFFFEQSVNNIDYCLKNTNNRPYTGFFENALKAYQKNMPSFCSMDLEKRIRQTGFSFPKRNER